MRRLIALALFLMITSWSGGAYGQESCLWCPSNPALDGIMIGTGGLWGTQDLSACTGATQSMNYNATTHVISCVASTGAPGAPDKSVQFNDGGGFGGDAALIWEKTTHTLLGGGLAEGAITFLSGTLGDFERETTSTTIINGFGANFASAWRLNPAANATSGNSYGVYAYVDVDPTNTKNLGNLFGLSGAASSDGSGTASGVYGGIFSSTSNAAGLVTDFYGVYSNAGPGNGNGTNAYGGRFGVSSNRTSVATALTNGYGVIVKTPSITGGATIGSAYGLYVENQSGATTNNYAIYTNTGLVHFGDAVSAPSLGFTNGQAFFDEAANTTGLRNGTNGQVLRLYKTFTSSTNFERMFVDASSDPLSYQIGTEYGSAGGSPRILVLGGGSVTTDVAPEARDYSGKSAWSQATSNTTGGNTNVSAGLGRRFYTIVTFGSTGGKTFTLTANGTAVVLTEGVTFQCVTAGSNNACASNLATAINADGTLSPLMTATAVAAQVFLDKKSTLNTLTIATNAGAPATATSGKDGDVNINSTLVFNSSVTASGVTLPSTGWMEYNTGSGDWLIFAGKAFARNAMDGNNGGMNMVAGAVLGFSSSSSDPTVASDTLIRRQAAGQLKTVNNTAAGDSTTQTSCLKALVNNTATTFLKITMTSGSQVGGNIHYSIEDTDATNRSEIAGEIPFAAVDIGGTITCNIKSVDTDAQLAGAAAGFANTFACADATGNILNLNATALTTGGTDALRIRALITQNGTQTMVCQ